MVVVVDVDGGAGVAIGVGAFSSGAVAVNVDPDVDVDVDVGAGAFTFGADVGGDDPLGAAGAPVPYGTTSPGEVDHGTGSRFSCAHAARAAAR